MPLDPTQPSDLIKFRYYAQAVRQNFQALYDVFGPDVTVPMPPTFPAGTKMWFYQDTAPPGWVITANVGDSLLGIKADSGALFAVGGNQYGTWQQPDHRLTEGQMPRHSHYLYNWSGGYNVKKGSDFNVVRTSGGDGLGMSTTGDDQPHNHGDSWRPQTAVGIIAEKQ